MIPVYQMKSFTFYVQNIVYVRRLLCKKKCKFYILYVIQCVTNIVIGGYGMAWVIFVLFQFNNKITFSGILSRTYVRYGLFNANLNDQEKGIILQ